LSCAREFGAETKAFVGADLRLPLFEPHLPEREPAAEQLVAALRQADGVILSSPGYHGLVSGLLKNALDYTEDMKGDSRSYFDGRAIGCIVVANGAQALGSTLASLRSIVHALRGWPTPYGATLMSGGAWSGGEPRDAETRNALALVARQVADFAAMSLNWQAQRERSEAVG
jgi:FMN reductase